jgi:hypothetical protein
LSPALQFVEGVEGALATCIVAHVVAVRRTRIEVASECLHVVARDARIAQRGEGADQATAENA